MQNYIYGAGGHGKVVLDAMQVARIDCTGFVDDKEISTWADLKVYQPSALDLEAEIYLHLAVGNSKVREAIATRFANARFFSISHPAAIIAKTAKISSGTFIAALSVIAPDVQIGNHCIINHAAVVDHDCIVGDYTHIAPHSSLGGGVMVGKSVLIGAGAVVTKNIAVGMTVVGNPAKSMN
jgi:sugar O-acyltransferase (sialic acid O-acetyltransferase NeuD family)